MKMCFQWMLLLFLILLSESIMTIMFLLHQHSAVLQIQVQNNFDTKLVERKIEAAFVSG